MEMLLAGEWRGAGDGATEMVRSPYDGRPVGSVPLATIDDAIAAVDDAEAAARVQRETPAHERVAVLLRAADLADQRAEDIAQTISAETGKPISEARGEASRSGAIIRLAAHEGSQLYGSTLPLDANPGTGLEKIGFTVRQPCGIVVAITPFNYPALLVLHKIAPALAAGNAVVLKPARSTPMTALKLAQCFVDAGLAPGALSVLTGSGATLGDRLVTDPRVRKVSFTGSTATGTHLAAVAGIKKLSLELGASCPVIVLPDADIDMAASAVAAGGYINAGQVCISVQRVIVDERVEADFLDALVPKVDAITLGDPARDDTRLGSLISETEATRVALGDPGRRRVRREGPDGRRPRRCGHHPRGRSGGRPAVTVRPRRIVRAGRRGILGPRHRRRDRDRQRQRIRPGRRHLHLRRGGDGTRDAPDRRRQHPHQLDPAVAGRPDALRRAEGQRHRQGRCPLSRHRNDRRKDHRHPRPAVVNPEGNQP